MADHDDSKRPAGPAGHAGHAGHEGHPGAEGPPGERPAPPRRGLNVGDSVIIQAKVVRLEANGALTVTVGPLETPGHTDGYLQTITLHDAGLAERV